MAALIQESSTLISDLKIASHTHGHVDGVDDNELRGWFVNYSRPSRPEYVMCRGDIGERRFFPTVMRGDVNALFGVPGVFGFSIPIELLEPVGRCVTVMDVNGVVLERGERVCIETGHSPIVSDDLTNIFLHIPKTAGTSLRDALLRRVPVGKRVLLYPGMPGIMPESLNRLPVYQRSRLRWVFGHCKFGLGRFLLQRSRYITFVRATAERLQSNFNHHAALRTLFEINGEFLPASTVINEGLTEEFDNITTRTLAGLELKDAPLGTIGVDELELALHNIRQSFLFVGKQERASEDLRILENILGIGTCELVFDNVTPDLSQRQVNDIGLVDWPRVMRRNWVDERLYRLLEEEDLLSRQLCS